MPFTCEQLEKTYQVLVLKKQELIKIWEQGASLKDFTPTQNLKKKIENLVSVLKKYFWPFESLEQKDLQAQYEYQKKVFEDVEMLERLKNGAMGIKAINGKEYPFPAFKEVLRMAKENREVLTIKTEQGFTQLLIVPFGMSLDNLIEKYKDLLWKHYREKKLFGTMKHKEDRLVFPDHLPFRKDTIERIRTGKGRYKNIWRKEGNIYEDKNSAIWVAETYKNADILGKLVYNPKEFSPNHQGKTKRQILEEQNIGYRIILIEDMPIIPLENPNTQHDRTQIDRRGSTIKGYVENGKTLPSLGEYLQAIITHPMYQYEVGMFPEDQLMYAMLYLSKYHQVVDDGHPSFQIGAYFCDKDITPFFYWSRAVSNKALVDTDSPEFRSRESGIRTAVLLNKK